MTPPKLARRQGDDAAVRVARWRWVLVPMVVLIAGCLPDAPAAPGDPLRAIELRGYSFTAAEPPPGATPPGIDPARLGKRRSDRLLPADVMDRFRREQPLLPARFGRLSCVEPPCTEVAVGDIWLTVLHSGEKLSYGWVMLTAPNGDPVALWPY